MLVSKSTPMKRARKKSSYELTDGAKKHNKHISGNNLSIGPKVRRQTL